MRRKEAMDGVMNALHCRMIQSMERDTISASFVAA